MKNTDERYTKEAVKESIKIDRNDLDIDVIATICTMIQETLHREASKFTDVVEQLVEQLAKTYRKEFTMGDFGVCIAVSDDVHNEPIVSLVTGSIPATFKNLKFMSQGVREMMNDKATD